MTEPPYIADRELRAEALTPDRSFIVQAPAGSGKTTLLTQRFLRLLSLSAAPESIIAITFTRKAAEEMRTRIINALLAVQSDTDDLDSTTRQWARAALENSVARDWHLTENAARLRIMTIDALGHLIVRRNPILAGAVGAQDVVEDADTLYQRAARLAIEELGTNSDWSDDVALIAGHLDNNWGRLERLLTNMLSKREQWLPHVIDIPDRAYFGAAIDTFIRDALRPVAECFATFSVDPLMAVCRYAGTTLRDNDPGHPIAALGDITELPGTEPADLDAWLGLHALLLTKSGTSRKRFNKNQGFPPGDPVSKENQAALLEILAGMADVDGLFQSLDQLAILPPRALDEGAWRRLTALFTLLKIAAAHLRLVFQQSGFADFTEVTLGSLAALGEEEAPSDASMLLDYQIEHLLVDEFQDTSVTQYHLIQRLVAGWGGDDGRSLFFVGDPLQSIYRFRQADVSRFIKTFEAQAFQSVPLTALRLSANFRSDPNIIDWINHLLATLSASPGPFTTETRLSAVRERQPDSRVEVHVNDDSAADQVLRLVQAARAEDPQQSIAILVRSRIHLGDISKQLTDANIPIGTSDIDRLIDQPVVLDLLALTRALLHLSDRTAWLAILRAPWLGLPLHALFLIANAARDSTIYETLGDPKVISAIEPNLAARLAEFTAVITDRWQWVGRRPISEVVRTCWEALRGPEIAEACARLDIAERYFELLARLEQRESSVSAETLWRYLERQFVSPPPGSGNPVQVMTIHRAKGLEFDVVIIPGLDRFTRGDIKQLLMWKQTPDDRLVMSLLPRAGESGGLYTFIREADKLANEAEKYRLLYVALTRARHRLHLLGALAPGKSAPPKGSLQHILWPVIAESFQSSAVTDPDPEPVSQISRVPQTIRRMQEAILPDRLLQDANANLITEPKIDIREALEFSWARASAKYVGTVIHDILRSIGEDGVRKFAAAWERTAPLIIRTRLRAAGVTGNALDEAVDKVRAGVEAVLVSERGRWLFSEQHTECHSEYALTTTIDANLVNVVIDRCFVDANDVRWIVDFKTGEHGGADVEAFLDSEVERYQAQLNLYARVMRAFEQKTTRVALYFPLLNAWREWQPTL